MIPFLDQYIQVELSTLQYFSGLLVKETKIVGASLTISDIITSSTEMDDTINFMMFEAVPLQQDHGISTPFNLTRYPGLANRLFNLRDYQVESPIKGRVSSVKIGLT